MHFPRFAFAKSMATRLPCGRMSERHPLQKGLPNMMMRRQIAPRGFTIVEVMVAMLISFLSITAIYAIFSSQNQAAIRNDDQREMNGLVNTSFSLLVKNTRMAGFRISTNNALNPINNYTWSWGLGMLNGGTALRDPLMGDIKPGTDGVMLLSADNRCLATNSVDNGALFTNSGGGTARVCEPNCFTAASPNNYVAGDRAIVSGFNGAIFVKFGTGITVNQTQTGVCGGGPFTSVPYLGIDELNLATRNTTSPGDPGTGQLVIRLETAHLYYVNTQNTLKRLPIDTAFAPEIISDGVEDMQIRYDLRSDCNTTSADFPSAYWCSGCNQCDAPSNLPIRSAGVSPLDSDNPLGKLRSARVALIIRSIKPDQATFMNRGLPLAIFDHTPAATPDSYRRRAVTQSVLVKNLEMQDL